MELLCVLCLGAWLLRHAVSVCKCRRGGSYPFAAVVVLVAGTDPMFAVCVFWVIHAQLLYACVFLSVL